MSVVSQLETISNTLYPDATFMLASKFKASRSSFDIDSVDYPLILVDNEIRKNNSIRSNNNITKRTRIVLSVLDRMDIYSTSTEIQTKQDAMELIADKIIVNMYQQTNINPEGNQDYTTDPVFHHLVTNLVGVACDVTFNDTVVIDWEYKYVT